MIKVKDGYATLVETKYRGSDQHLLRSDGGVWGVHAGRNNEANKIVRTDGNGLLLTGTIIGSSTILGTRLISTIAEGTPPLTVTSKTLVTNLNADMLDGVGGNPSDGVGYYPSAYVRTYGGTTPTWCKICSFSMTSTEDVTDVAFMVHSSYKNSYSIVHIRSRYHNYVRLSALLNNSLNNSKIRAYYDDKIENVELWAYTGESYSCYNFSLLYATTRTGYNCIDAIKFYQMETGTPTLPLYEELKNSYISNNVASANKLATSRTISLIGSITGSGSFDGSNNLSINTITTHDHTCIISSGKLACEATTNRSSGLRLYEIYNNDYPFAYGNVIQFNGSNGVGQLACQWGGTGLAYRSAPDTSTTFTNWATIITSNNYSTLLNNTYLLRGDSNSYNNSKWLSFSNDSGGITGCMGVNDLWRIYGRSTATNAGYLEIATADDGCEPIYVRLYAQVFLNLKRTLTLLDGNGDTSIPGKLTVSEQVRATTAGCSWINGQRDYYAALSITNSPDKLSYSPWIRLTLASGYWVSMGTISTKLYFVGSSTSRTDNGYDIGFVMNFSNGDFTILGSSYAAHFYENSDISLKKNIEIITDSDNIPQLKLFDWKEDGLHSYGFIAQELEELGYSELVSDDGNKKTVNYSAALSLTVAKLLNKIKELENEIENLKKIKINTF